MTATDRAAALELARAVVEQADANDPCLDDVTADLVPISRALLAAEAERERLHSGLTDLTEYDCEYGDGCPVFGSRHGACFGCRARRVLAYATKATTDTERHDG